ncbi:regulator of microtubule dynamics protein 1 [Pieris rapae]|uniref:regulator of microtubule dynamics protein 1 n=1 Tax=Pieris rapae TaxID=64459 RepID=UPI001E27E9FB|nr:regulator of microtubule dynamics protein 1 [Pieris rapae]XP_045485542.1 regulator of microtubule dynamics protein 1 [Pieris rapae]XP_045485570.1 regulator of microtubule dynamics protein 1 [Pieris rapae]
MKNLIRSQYMIPIFKPNFFSKNIIVSMLQRNLRNYKFFLMRPIKFSIVKSVINIKIPITFAIAWPAKLKFTPSEQKETLKPAVEVTSVADTLFENGKYEECFKLLSSTEDQNNIEIKWRVCRVLYNIAKQPKHDQAHRDELISKAYSIIAEELENHWDHFAVQKWYALILDLKSTNDGVKRKIQELVNVKKHMELAISLNPNDAALLHMLGEWCYQVTEFPWLQRKTAESLYNTPLPYSTYEDALDYFLKAEAAQPRFYSVNLLRLGCCYLKLNKEDQAKYYLKLAASYPAKSNEDHLAKKEAAEILRKLKVKCDFTISP